MYRLKRITFFALLALFGAIAIIAPCPGLGQDSIQDSVAKLSCDEPPCDAVTRGRAAFKERNLGHLGGNGRSCADCHIPSESFQLSPATAKARFEAMQAKRAQGQAADDPLFLPVDADDFRVNGNNASDFSTLWRTGSFV